MRQIIELALPAQQADTLIILLPGAYQQPEDFINAGFVSAVRVRKIAVDLILAELSFEDIANQRALSDIHHDLVEPALSTGYQHIWLAGISIGGYVAMAYADHFPGQLAGLLLLAPYPGNRLTTAEIAYAGGIQAWNPDTIPSEDTERANWYWLKKYGNAGKMGLCQTEVHLGYGENDRFAESHSIMAQALPPRHVDKIPGDHAWPVWQQLWLNFLEKRFIEYGQHE